MLLKTIMKQTGMAVKSALSLTIGLVNPTLLNLLKTGGFRFPEGLDVYAIVNQYIQFRDFCADHKITPMYMFKNNQFAIAFRWVVMSDNFDMATFMKKIGQKWFDLKPQGNAIQWYSLLVDIYNLKNRDPIEKIYGKED
jgi:hypothetical protein